MGDAAKYEGVDQSEHRRVFVFASRFRLVYSIYLIFPCLLGRRRVVGELTRLEAKRSKKGLLDDFLDFGVL